MTVVVLLNTAAADELAEFQEGFQMVSRVRGRCMMWKQSRLGRQAMVFLIQQHHLSYAVGTEIEDVAGREIGVAAAALSQFIVSSFPLSPFNSIPGSFSIGLHYMQFLLSHRKVCYSIQQ